MWRWWSINIGGDAFGEGVHLGGICIGSDGAPDLHRGWVWRDGAPASVAEWRIRTEVAADGFTQRVVHLDVVDKAGRQTHLRGDVLRVAPLPRAQGGRLTLVNEGLTRWTLLAGPDRPVGAPPAEVATGYGIAEYLHQLDGDGRPIVPVG
jgi:hypothetical protein